MDRYKITIETYNRSAEKYRDKFMAMNLYDDTYDRFCELVNGDNAQILEIACGPGNVTKYLLAKRPYYRITGIDLAPRMIELAKEANPLADFQVMDCRNIDSIDKKYDAIFCGFCMPYLSKEDCTKLINDSSNLLKSGGIFYFSTMEDEYAKSGFETTSFSGKDMVYIYYHQADFLSSCLEKNGFRILNLERKKYPEPDGTFLTDMIFIAKKN